MYKIFIAQKSHFARRVLSLATIRSQYYFNFIPNETRSSRELFNRPSYLLRAKFINDTNLLVFGVGQGRGVLIAEESGHFWVWQLLLFYYPRQHICYSTYMLSPSICPSCLSDGWIIEKWSKLGLWNFHHTVAPFLVFWGKFHPEILRGSPKWSVKQGRGG